MKRVILVLIIIFCKRASTARQDLLENIRVSKANEPELNDFLRSVLRHKEDFRWIRNSVDRIRLQQLTRNLYATSAPDEVDEEFNPAYKSGNDEENIFFDTKAKRRSGLPHQYSKYRRPINDVYPYILPNEQRYKRSFEFYKDDDGSFNDDNEQSNVKVLTRSDIGVRNVPGVKVQRNHRHAECLSNHESHEYISPDANGNGTADTNIMGEYYYSSPHDLLGISQDLKCDKSRTHNETCVKTKKNAQNFDDTHVRVRKSGKDDRSIKVNIVDKGKLIKTVEQNENSNSLVLTFKGESDEEKANKDLTPQLSLGITNTSASFNSETALTGNLTNSNNTANFNNATVPLTAYRRPELSNVTDDTLENIDKILRHDQDSLKNSSYIPAYLKVKKASLDDSEQTQQLIHKKETRMIKDGDFEHEDKVMVVRNRPHNNEDIIDDSNYRQSIEYDERYADDPYNNNNPDRSRSDVNEGNYDYKPIIYRTKQRIRNPIDVQKLSKDQAYREYGEKAYKNRRTHKYHGTDLEDVQLQYDNRRMRNQHRSRSNSETKILPNGIEETVTQDPPINKKNLLEDETEPTSAAEQRELEKKDYAKFGTTSMDSFTTEKMLVIPLKKTYRGKPSDVEESDAKFKNLEEYNDYESNLIDLGERPEADDKKFHVKDSRDMIHTKMKKSNLYDNVEPNNEIIKSSELESSLNSNKLSDKLTGHGRFVDIPYSEKIRKAIKSDDTDKINRRETFGNHADENQYKQPLSDEYSKNVDRIGKADSFYGRRILSLPESKDIKSVMPQFDIDLDYQNGISNAINIRVKRTEDFEDLSNKATADDDDDDDDSGEYTNLGQKLRYEKKHVIQPKDVIPIDKLVMGAEDTIGFGDIPTCISKRMNQDIAEININDISIVQNNEKESTNDIPKRKTETEKGNTNASHNTDNRNDGNFQINESPKDIVETKLKTKEDNEFSNFTKHSRKTANNTSIQHKINDDDSENHEDEVNNYLKEKEKKLKHAHHGKAHHSILDENEDVRFQLLQVGNQKHQKHAHKHKSKEHHGSHTGEMNEIVILKKDLHEPSLTADEVDKRRLRQNLVFADSSDSPGDNVNQADTNQGIGSANGCNENQHDDRNELQIIEKDQAIIFKFTTPKMPSEKSEAECDSGNSKSENMLESSDTEGGSSESNKEYCESGEEIDNPNPDLGGSEEEELKPTGAAQESKCGPVLSIVRDVNGTFDSKTLDKAFGKKAKPVDLSDDAELFDNILGLMAKYKTPQTDRDAIGNKEFAKLFIQNRSSSFDDDDIVNVNHHLHKDNRAHPPKNKELVCSKSPKHEETNEDDANSLSKDEYLNDSSENDLDKNMFFGNSKPSHSAHILKNSITNASSHDLDSVESFTDIVEKQSKGKRTKKHIIYNDDFLPSGFANLTQVEVEEMDSGQPTVRKKRYLKFLYKNSSKLGNVKVRRESDSDFVRDGFFQRGTRHLNDYNMYRNEGDYGALDYDNYQQKYARASKQNNQAMHSNMPNVYFVPSMQNVPNNIRYLQSNQNLQSIQNMRNRYDTARKFNLIKNYRNISSEKEELDPININNASSPLEDDISSSTSIYSSSTLDLDQSTLSKNGSKKGDATKKSNKKNENMKEILNGQLIMKIIDKFTEKLKTNEVIYKRFGKRIPRKRAELISEKLSAYRDRQTKKDIKHAEIMLHQVIIMLNRVVMDQVHRKICMIIPPDLKSYLAMITSNTCKGGNKNTNQIAEGYPLPELRGGNGTIAANQPPPPDDEQGDFLFESDIGGQESKYNSSNHDVDTSETAAKKIHLIKKLLNKYNNMSVSCQVKVQPVKDYLTDHMEMLQKIKNKEGHESTDTTTELDDSCENENAKPPKLNDAAEKKVPPAEAQDNDVSIENRSSTMKKVTTDEDAIATSTMNPDSSKMSATPSDSPEPLSESPAPSSVNTDDSTIKVEARDITPSHRLNSNKNKLQDSNVVDRSVGVESQEDDAKEVEAAKQKFIKNYGHGRFYPLSGRYSDPITHFQSELARENSYKEPYIMENNAFNLNNRPNYLLDSNINPMLEENQMIVNSIGSVPYNQQRNYLAEPERNSMMLDALKNPVPVIDNPQNNRQSKKQRRSLNTTYWNGSDKYQKLVEAATELRRKRDIEERLGKLFAGRSAKYKKAYEYKPNNAYPDLSKVNFETPLIYRVV